MDNENQNQTLPNKGTLPSSWQTSEEVNPDQEKNSSPEPSPEVASSDSIRAFRLENKSPLRVIKKIFLFLLIGIILAGLAFSIIKIVFPRIQKPKEVTLTYWGLWESDRIMNQVLSDWNKEHPNIKIKYSLQAKEQYRERLQSALARGEGPDIFRFHITWLPMFRNQLDPIPTEVMSSSQFEATFYPVAASHLRFGTNYYGIPLEIDTLALFYNKKIFQLAGKTPPKTWDELRQLAMEMTVRDEAGRIKIAGVALGTTNNVDHWSDILGLMMLQNGVDLSNPRGELAEDALAFYSIFNTNDRVWDMTLPNSTFAFATEKVAMYFGFSWDVFEIKNINPNLEFGIVKVPPLPGTNIAWASFWVEGVNNRSQHKELAWEFLKYLSSKEVMSKLYQIESQERLFGEIYSRIEMAELLRSNPLVTPFIEQAPYSQTWYLCSRTFDNGINERMIDYFKDAVNAVNTNKTPAEALKTTASGIAQLLSQYGLGTYVTH